MKYGDTLQQRSIPLWETYNVDYNDIKHLIKVQTTQGQGQAKAIPGSNNEAKQLLAFEEELYRELREQHQRVDLFVRSKTGEIGRRLSHLDKQITQLKIRSFATGQSRISVRRLEKFSKLEAATLKVGEEIQSLSRFVGAQRLAFQKLLKKYKRWTGSPDLGNRFREGVFDRPSSFSRTDLQTSLAQWTEVLASVRAPFDGDVDWRTTGLQPKEQAARASEPESERSQQNRPDAVNNSWRAGELYSVWESGSNIDIDTALAVVPMGPGAAKAVYWIHPDNIVQIHVLLLQYTRLPKSKNSDSPLETPPSSRSSPRGSLYANANGMYCRTDDEVGVIVCDDLCRFVQRQNSETISDKSSGAVAEVAAATISYSRGSRSGDAVVVYNSIGNSSPQTAQSRGRETPNKATIEPKWISRFFDSSSADQMVNQNDPKESKQAQRWFQEHQEVQPLVQLQSRRTRFVGLENSRRGGMWVTLDRDVLMNTCSRESITESKDLSTIIESGKSASKSFPHAILQVRIEGDVNTDLVSSLDFSHLTERVRGFSLATHAVATLYKPDGMSRPFWLPALEQDIRKVPATNKPTKGLACHGRFSPEQANTRHTSISATSTTNGPSGSGFSGVQGESSATSAPDVVQPPSLRAFKKKRRQSQRKRALWERAPQGTNQRYWNEFDDGSEGSDNEAYTIFVDPNASSSFPSVVAMSKLFTTLGSKINVAEQKVTAWFRSSEDVNNRERESLINGDRSPSVYDSDMSDADIRLSYAKARGHKRYATFPAIVEPHAVGAREKMLFRSCLASFAASFIFLIVAAILKTTGRRKAETTVDAGILIGVAASMVFAIIAVGSVVGRKDDVGWVHRTIVCLLFVCVVVGCVALLAALD